MALLTKISLLVIAFLFNLIGTLLKLKEEVSAYLERVVGLLGRVSDDVMVPSLFLNSPTRQIKNARGPQRISAEVSMGWTGKKAGGPSRPIGRNKPKTKVIYRQKTKMGLGVGQQACVKPDPKGKSPAQHPLFSEPAQRALDWAVDENLKSGGVVQQEQVCFEPDSKGKVIA
jgi:hypothetical protein